MELDEYKKQQELLEYYAKSEEKLHPDPDQNFLLKNFPHMKFLCNFSDGETFGKINNFNSHVFIKKKYF